MIASISQHIKSKIQIQLSFKTILLEELKIMGMIAASVFVVLQFSKSDFTQVQILLHSCLYAVCFGSGDLLSRIIPLLYYFQRDDQPIFSVGTIWISSFTGFCTGFFIYSTMRFQAGLYLPELFEPLDQMLHLRKFLLFIPIWFLVTYIMVFRELTDKTTELASGAAEPIQPETGSANPAEVSETQSEKVESSQKCLFILPKGSLIESIDPATISHISVEEHYADIYFWRENQLKTVQVRMSLKEALKQLSTADFLQIHRSHLVNLAYISDLEKKNGQLNLLVNQGTSTLPVSRRNSTELLSLLKKLGKLV